MRQNETCHNGPLFLFFAISMFDPGKYDSMELKASELFLERLCALYADIYLSNQSFQM